ncbi:flagellar basal body P-ring formation chaperone FlgA [Paracoccus laeviglucosivorans]|uniref:Flagella basal body P-ring formation protein FlgA n=1 Tax=Paracoccus laeviglucosivorans TaxID=1197861 RepID=A0A521DC78_9RHOB|nr:flagellar basal body P-ring formation chaperone FlgA [Paracoccus laeviglucosivorans]SMO69283.1 flagella basal body P-ring formation protein FlgA [Paracoccus laeviglucosivorans]
MRYLALFAALLPLPALAEAVVAARTLRAGIVITPQDVRLAPETTGRINDPAHAIGQELRVMVSEGRPVQPEHIAAPTVVSRNQRVTLIYEKGALRIAAEGRALMAGSIGQMVRVMNNESRVTVIGRILPDGSVMVAQN